MHIKKKKKIINHDQVGFFTEMQRFFMMHKIFQYLQINVIYYINKFKNKKHTITLNRRKNSFVFFFIKSNVHL